MCKAPQTQIHVNNDAVLENFYKKTSPDDIDYQTVLNVTDSFELVLAIPNVRKVVGTTIVAK